MSSGAINPVSDYNPPSYATPNAWDVVRVAGVICPGYCQIRGFERKWCWDKKTGKGAQGTTTTYTGKPAVTGEISFFLWTGLHFQQWESFRPLFKYDPTRKNIQAVDVFHPSLADLEIKSLVCEEIAPIRHVGENLFVQLVKLCEYVPPPKAAAVSTPSGSNSGSGTGAGPGTGGAAPAPTDPLQLKIQQLYQEFQKP